MMSRMREGQLELGHNDEVKDNIIGWYKPASDEAVYDVLAADESSDDGRSNWLWFRLANGDLILGFFPQGDTYFKHEVEHSG